MAKLSNIKKVDASVDVSEFFDEQEPVIFRLQYFTKEAEVEIGGAMLEGRKMEIDPETRSLKMDVENFRPDPAAQAKAFSMEILYGVAESPLDEEWTIETVNRLRTVSPGAANKIHAAIKDLNAPFLSESSKR